MSTPVAIDMDKPRTFFNPHPGFAGAAIPIPGPVKTIAEDIDGKTMSLKDAVERLKAVGIGRIEVVSKYDYIALWLGEDPNKRRHMFRVICYK